MKGIIPRIAEQVQKVLDEMASLGHPMICTDGYRTWAEQNALFAKRPKVTNARGGESNHNYACAADCTFLVNGKPSWDGNLPWETYGRIAEKHGFFWGGRWTYEKDGIHDKPHIQMTFGYSIAQLQKMGEKKAIETLSQSAEKAFAPSMPPVAKEAVKSWEKAKSKGLVSDGTNPEEIVESTTLQWVFANGGVMQEPKSHAKQLQWYIVALDRTGWIDSLPSK